MHDVETMAYAGETPWHGLGTRVTNAIDAVTPSRFLKLAGLDWHVEKVPVVTADTGQETTHFATRRVSDGSILGVVGPGYTVLQNEEVFEWFGPLLETGRVTLEAGGALAGGSIVWGLARIIGLDELVRDGDAVVSYILLSHGHHGMRGISVGLTPERVVCRNTLAIAENDRMAPALHVKHTAGLHVALERVRDIIDVAEADFRATIEQYALLARTPVSKADLRQYIKIVIGADERKDEDLHPVTKRRVDRIVELASSGRGNRGESLWDGYNGVTEYLSYEAGRSADTRLRSLWFGPSKAMSARALEIGVSMAASG